MSEDRKVTGRCYCRAIRYEIADRPLEVEVCHCENCRRITGGQAVPWAIFPKTAFRFTNGAPATYRSDTAAIWSFCATCGTTLTYQSDERPDQIDVALVTLAAPADYPPTGDSNAEEKLPWVNLVSQSKP
jgi:hypothetical protein